MVELPVLIGAFIMSVKLSCYYKAQGSLRLQGSLAFLMKALKKATSFLLGDTKKILLLQKRRFLHLIKKNNQKSDLNVIILVKLFLEFTTSFGKPCKEKMK